MRRARVLVKATKQDVLTYFEQAGKEGATVAGLRDRYQLTERAAELHVEGLARRGLVTPAGPRRFALTHRGRQRLAYFRGETTGGRIRLV